MNDSKISVRYARALFDSASEKNAVDSIYSDMSFLSELSALKEVKEVLESPVIRPSKKRDILHALTRTNVNPLTLSLLSMVVRNGRENYIPAIAREFIHQTKIHKGITESVLTTAVKVDDKIRSQIKDLIAGIFKTKVELREETDKDIIGGFILRVEDSYIDASVRKRLRIIEKELKGQILAS
jgi:F-type H+-transporting ATPase subunit delta